MGDVHDVMVITVDNKHDDSSSILDKAVCISANTKEWDRVGSFILVWQLG